LPIAAGDRGALSLFGRKPEHHRLFAEHVADAETYVVRGSKRDTPCLETSTERHGRTVHEWRPKPSKSRKGSCGPDNHWFDCLVGCAVAASMAGVKAPGEAAIGRQRKRYSQDDLRRRDTW
jgi:hypothetical protein